jgi:RNA polymerase sigma-70 factor (ECF subfamily)
LNDELIAGPAREITTTPNVVSDVETLVAREAAGLLAYFARRVATLEDAADLLGDTLLAVWRRKATIPADETHVIDAASHSDKPLHVRALIADLDNPDREIVTLVYWEGFSLVEVPAIMSMQPSTVRSRHARARAQLRTALSESGDIA